MQKLSHDIELKLEPFINRCSLKIFFNYRSSLLNKTLSGVSETPPLPSWRSCCRPCRAPPAGGGRPLTTTTSPRPRGRQRRPGRPGRRPPASPENLVLRETKLASRAVSGFRFFSYRFLQLEPSIGHGKGNVKGIGNSNGRAVAFTLTVAYKWRKDEVTASKWWLVFDQVYIPRVFGWFNLNLSTFKILFLFRQVGIVCVVIAYR